MSGDDPYVVRRPLIGEAEECARVHVQVWQEAYAGLMPTSVLDALDPMAKVPLFRDAALGRLGEGRSLLVAVHRGTQQVVGFAAAGPPLDDDAPVPTHLYMINVLADHHGSGVGARLLAGVLGDRPSYLWVAEGNARAEAFYVKHGFARDGGRRTEQDFTVDVVRMTRR